MYKAESELFVTYTEKSGEGFAMIMFWTWVVGVHSSCGSRGLQFSELGETADTGTEGEDMKAKHSRK